MRVVKLDDKPVPETYLTNQCLYIQGYGWFSSIEKVPKAIRDTYKAVFAQQQMATISMKDALLPQTPANKKSTKKCTVC